MNGETRNNELRQVMKREISILREVLCNLQMEQRLLLENRSPQLREIVEVRRALFDQLEKLHHERVILLHMIAKENGEKLQSSDGRHLDCIQSEDCHIISLKETMIFLLEKLDKQSGRNKALLQSKISLTKRCISNIQQSKNAVTYGYLGTYQRAKKPLTLINHEV